MSAVRVYGPNQDVGIAVTTTGKGNVTSDGLSAYAKGVVLYDAAGVAVDLSTSAIVTGSVAITNSGAARTAALQQNRGADSLSNTGSDSAAILESRAYVHAWDSGASTWGRLKASQTFGTATSAYGLPSESWKYAAANGGVESSTADNAIQAANATKTHLLTSIQVTWAAIASVSEFIVKDGSTVIFRERLETAGGRFSVNFPRPLQGTANTALNWALGVSQTGKVYVNAQGVTI